MGARETGAIRILPVAFSANTGMRAELGTQTVTMPPHMIVLIYNRLLEEKEMNVMTELYRILKDQAGK